jgi:GTP-binding protein
VDFVLADIPGLIEGAAEGAGVGDRFLGHVERTRVLLHLVDANNEDVATAYRTVRDELEAYGAGLDEKPEVIALSKGDTIDDELAEALAAELRDESGAEVFVISGATGAGVDEVLDTLLRHIGQLNRDAANADEEEGGWSPL